MGTSALIIIDKYPVVLELHSDGDNPAVMAWLTRFQNEFIEARRETDLANKHAQLLRSSLDFYSKAEECFEDWAEIPRKNQMHFKYGNFRSYVWGSEWTSWPHNYIYVLREDGKVEKHKGNNKAGNAILEDLTKFVKGNLSKIIKDS